MDWNSLPFGQQVTLSLSSLLWFFIVALTLFLDDRMGIQSVAKCTDDPQIFSFEQMEGEKWVKLVESFEQSDKNVWLP